MKRFICWLFGHNYICLYRRRSGKFTEPHSDITGWKCQRCGETKMEQWDG